MIRRKRSGVQQKSAMAEELLYYLPGAYFMTRQIVCRFLLCLILPISVASAFGGELNWLGHWKGEDKREVLVHEIKKNYEFLHPGTTIKLTFDVDVEGEGSYYKMKVARRIVEMIETGKIEWDLFSCDVAIYNHVADLLGDPQWGRKYLVDFGEVPGFLASQKDVVVGSPFYRDKKGGIYPGPYIEGILFNLWYTRQAAAAIGIQVKERGMSVEEFLSYAARVADYNKRHGTRFPFLYLNSFNRIEALFEYLFKSSFIDPQPVIEETYDEKKAAAFLATLEIFEKLASYQPVVNEGWRSLDWRECEKDFLAGNGLFLPGGTYMYSHFRGNAAASADNGIPVEMPHVVQPNGQVGLFTNTFAVLKASPNRQAAIELSMMWAEPRVAEKWVEYTKNPTGIRGNLVEHAFDSDSSDVYERFLVDMERQYIVLPMRNFRAPTYAFGKDTPVGAEEFRNSLVLILEGKLGAREYYRSILTRMGRQ
ncbi:MAG: hypothetical protein ACD_75C00123G0003 [uncultured bacterium]|nr:MAG: hypothetical protein ACD_75C00123G0003 [uncultured bacterium]